MHYRKVDVGSWVGGTTWNDERFIGYIEAFGEDDTVQIRITQSDVTESVGEAVITSIYKVDRLRSAIRYEPAELRMLIDLALDSGDREWFAELAASLSAASVSSSKQGRGSGTGNANRRLNIH